MVQKSTALGITLLLSLTAFSQIATNNDTTCKTILPCHIAGKIAVDLIEGDSAKAELAETQVLVQQLQNKITAQDSVEAAHIQKEEIYKQQIGLYDEQKKISESVIRKLERSNKGLKIGVKVLGVVSGIGVVGTLVGFLLR